MKYCDYKPLFDVDSQYQVPSISETEKKNFVELAKGQP
jgi:hypothetical protein